MVYVEVELNSLAKSLAILICTCRSSSFFYKDKTDRRRYIMTFFNDLRLKDILQYGERLYNGNITRRVRKRCLYVGEDIDAQSCSHESDCRIEVFVRFCCGVLNPNRFLEVIKAFDNRRASGNCGILSRVNSHLHTDVEYRHRRSKFKIYDNERVSGLCKFLDSQKSPHSVINRSSSMTDQGISNHNRDVYGNRESEPVTTTTSSSSSEYSECDDDDCAANKNSNVKSDSQRKRLNFCNYDLDLFGALVNELTTILRRDHTLVDNDSGPNDITIEFERDIDMDYATGITGIPIEKATEELYVRPADYIVIAATTGFFTRALPFGGERFSYKSYLYGSNVIKLDATIEDTNKYREVSERVYRKLEISKSRLNVFIKRLTELTSGLVSFKSFSNLDISLQYTFSARDNIYSINLFYVRANDPCDHMIVYKKEYLTSLCHCENRTCAWRLCCILTPINTTTLDAASKAFLMDIVLKSFSVIPYIHPDSHETISCFTGLLMPNIINDCKSIGCMGLVKDTDIQQTDQTGLILRDLPAKSSGQTQVIRSSPLDAFVCPIHRFIMHNTTQRWEMINSQHGLHKLVLNFQQILLVHRPVTSSQCSLSNGQGNGLFTNYKAFNDNTTRHILLTYSILTQGYNTNLKTVAFKVYDSKYLVFRGDNDSSRSKYSVDNLYDNLRYRAPSQLYITQNLLTKIGFNVYATSNSTNLDSMYCRTFEHFDKNANSVCTVLCSTPLKILDDSGDLLDTDERLTINCLKLLKLPNYRFSDSPLEPYKTFEYISQPPVATASLSPVTSTNSLHTDCEGLHHKYEESSFDMSAYWPGVKLFTLRFKNNPILSSVTFTMFTCRKDTLIRTMDNNSLISFTRYCSNTDLINPPTLYTFQQMMLVKM